MHEIINNFSFTNILVFFMGMDMVIGDLIIIIFIWVNLYLLLIHWLYNAITQYKTNQCAIIIFSNLKYDKKERIKIIKEELKTQDIFHFCLELKSDKNNEDTQPNE